jgi:hypothetical protein
VGARPQVIEEGIRQHEEAYEAVAGLVGAPSRRTADVELDESEVIEDAEYELIAELGEGVRETPSGYEPSSSYPLSGFRRRCLGVHSDPQVSLLT